MQYRLNTKEKKVIAAIYCDPPDPHSGKTFLYYYHVHNSDFNGVATFVQFAKKFPTSKYINFYSKINIGPNGKGAFIQRINL
jgi:hypothetical protein